MKKEIIVLSLLVMMVSCGEQNSTIETSKNYYNIKLNQINEASIHTDLQNDFLLVGAEGLSSLGINGSTENSRPNAITFSWEYELPQDDNLFLLKISENEDLSDCWEYEINDNHYDVYNLKVGTKYYWNVSTLQNNYSSEISSFMTSLDNPRNLYIDGITNVRDIGGWMIDEHTRVRQGLAYRCGRLNKSSSDTLEVEITEEGISQMNDYLGIKSEIDLRLVNNNEVGKYTQSALGEEINYYQCPMGYNGNYLENNKLMVKKVFSLLSDKNNYPLMYHCNIGTDRTGLITYMLNGLLGVDQEDLFIDYEFSNLGKIDGTRNRNSLISNYVYTLNLSSGNTLSEKIANYLLNIGINQIQIDTIIDLFTEKI